MASLKQQAVQEEVILQSLHNDYELCEDYHSRDCVVTNFPRMVLHTVGEFIHRGCLFL